MEPSANQARTGKLRQLVSSVHRHVKTKSRSMLSSSETSTELKQSDLQRCIATVNSYSNHLGELRGLWEQHGHLLSSQPESKQRIDLIIQRSLADIEHCERILQRCSLVNLEDDGETRMWRKLRWELIDRHRFEHHRAQAERNDNTITTHIFALHHLILDRAVSKLLNGVRTPAANANGPATENSGRGVNGNPQANTGLAVPRLVVTRPGLPASPRPVRGASTPPPPRPVVFGKGKQAVEHRQRPSSEPLRQPPTVTTAKTCCNHRECHVEQDADMAIEEEQNTSPQQQQPASSPVMVDATTISTTDFAAGPTSTAQQARGHGVKRLAGPCCSKGENMGVDAGNTGIKFVH